MSRIILFIIATTSLFILLTGTFGATGIIYPVPQAIPGVLPVAQPESATGTKTIENKISKISIKKRFQPQQAYRDDSLLRFVSRTVPLTDKWYKPTPLLSISGSYINEAGRKSLLREDARDALRELWKAFYDEFKIPLTVISGYRSAVYQQRLWDLGRCTDSLCAPPWYSEHQLGLAVDLFDATTEDDFLANGRYKKYVAWLQANAHLYGWHQSYQKWEDIDEYEVEPWHWRYIWVEMATRLKNLGWTYTEYIRFNETMLGW